MSKISLGILAAATMFMCTIAPTAGQRNGGVADLAKNLPEKPDRPKTVVVPGDLKVNIKEWVAPTLGSRPHDPYAAPDGTIYWAGMWADVIGHVDPKTNAIKEYPLPTKRTGPH